MLIPHCPALRSARACCAFIVVLSGRVLANPEFIPLGDIPGGIFWSHAHVVSADGTAVVGFSHGGAPGQEILGPFLWMEGTGMVPLGDNGARHQSLARQVAGIRDCVPGRKARAARSAPS